MVYAAGVLLETTDGLIALHHRDNKPGIASPDKWAFFGGMGEIGEKPLQTVVRELYEELEIHLEPEQLHLIHSYTYQAGNTVHIFHYPVTHELDHTVLHEGQGWALLCDDEIRQLNIVPEHLRILENFWNQKKHHPVYLYTDTANQILMPTDSALTLTLTQLLATTSPPSETPRYLFTQHNHPQFVLDVYSIPVTNDQPTTVNISKYITITPDTIKTYNFDFHIQSIFQRYWKLHNIKKG